MVEPEGEEKACPASLTLASRQRVARELGFSQSAVAVLENHPHLENGLSLLLDSGQTEPAFRLIARMLQPASAILWVVLCHRFLRENQNGKNPEEDGALAALIEYARQPSPDKATAAQNACLVLGGTHHLGVAGSALSTLPSQPGENHLLPVTLFSDLIGRVVWLISLSETEDSGRQILAKQLASRGVALALSGQAG